MKLFGYITLSVAITLQLAAQSGSSNQNSQQASDRVSEQLKGLKFVHLIVWVSPFHIPEYAEIDQRIEKTVKEYLLKTGLLLGDEQGAVLSIEVDSYSIDDKALQDRLIVRVWTKLHEEATLKRAPSLGNPHGYDTWDYGWVELVRKEDLLKFVLGEVKDQIEEFCDDWQLARDWDRSSGSGSPQTDTGATDWDKIMNTAQTYFATPTSENAHEFYAALPTKKGDWGTLKGDRKKAESFIWDNLDVLDKKVLKPYRNAVKIAVGLFPISDGIYGEWLNNMLGDLIRVDPKMFLEETGGRLAELRKRGSWNDGYILCNGTILDGESTASNETKLKELKLRIVALKTVKDESLAGLRDECIKIIERRISTFRIGATPSALPAN
jgi:hypothetical protein